MAGSWHVAGALAFALAPTLAQPAWAQSPEQLDQLAQSGDVPEHGLALARSQASAGAFLEALATLERTLAAKPKNRQAKLLHASLLCRIDDRTGAAVEFARLKAKDFGKDAWAEARAPCTVPDETPPEATRR